MFPFKGKFAAAPYAMQRNVAPAFFGKSVKTDYGLDSFRPHCIFYDVSAKGL